MKKDLSGHPFLASPLKFLQMQLPWLLAMLTFLTGTVTDMFAKESCVAAIDVLPRMKR
jgi:hypothetical protein